MKTQEAIKTLDEVIPSPDSKMVDEEHIEIAIAWKTIRNTLRKEAENACLGALQDSIK